MEFYLFDVECAIDLVLAFERYAEEDPHYEAELKERDKKLGKPEHDDWENVKRFFEFLGSFYQLTLRVSGSKYVTANLFFRELLNVSALLKELSVGDDLEMSMMANKMKEKCDKYWGDPKK